MGGGGCDFAVFSIIVIVMDYQNNLQLTAETHTKRDRKCAHL